ncbi:MAG TPA: hypothetical protein VKZ75_04415, partial [Cyclobacteriaceae bacterium]|nr:hypothetical protein [Cyclobacteriaceae bacterium]
MHKVIGVFFIFLSGQGILLAQSGTGTIESAKQKFDNGDYHGAASALTKILETDPRNKAALNLRG